MDAVEELVLLVLITHEACGFYRAGWLPCTFSESEPVSSLVQLAILWTVREVHALWRGDHLSAGCGPSLQDALRVSQGQLLAVTDNG